MENFNTGWGINPVSTYSNLMGTTADTTGGAGFMAAGSGLPGSVGSQGGGLWGGLQQGAQGAGLGMNLNTLNLGLSGLGTLGNIWSAWNANKLAKAQFDFTKQTTNTNLNNQISSYNTALDDKARSRAAVEGQSNEQRDKYITDHQLTRSQ